LTARLRDARRELGVGIEGRLVVLPEKKTNTRDEERYHRTKKAALKQQLIASGWQVAPPVVQAKA
jgi:hypothetical protein